MNQVDQGSPEFPPCGYGLLGLCCSDCLRGPCRISPFEKTQTLCGAESDLLVAGNLCRLAAKEFALALKSFIQVAGEFRKSNESPGAFSKASTENLSGKYGIPAEEIIPFLDKETVKLLAPWADPSPLIFSSLFPERALPQGNPERRCGPLLSELFGLLNWKDHGAANPEELLWRCLNSAACMLIVEEITHDIRFLLHPPPSEADGKREEGIIPLNFSNFPQPVLVSLVEEEYPQSAEMQKMATALGKVSGVLSISLQGTKGLIQVCRSVREKWHRPIFDLPMAVLVESPNILSILAPLALGLSTVSDPSLPIQGSKKVEEFFSSGLSKAMGNFYLPARDETALSRLSRVLAHPPHPALSRRGRGET